MGGAALSSTDGVPWVELAGVGVAVLGLLFTVCCIVATCVWMVSKNTGLVANLENTLREVRDELRHIREQNVSNAIKIGNHEVRLNTLEGRERGIAANASPESERGGA